MNKFVIVRETNNNVVEVISSGKQGIPGKSAYQIAVSNGFEGTEKEWLASLKGDAFTYDDFTNEQLAQITGPQGKTGYYYTPSVSKDGILSWTNSGNLSNPDPISIKGPEGKAATIAVGTVSTGEEGTNVIVTNTGTTNNAILNFTIPKGSKGDKGDIGEPFRITKVYTSVGDMNADYNNEEVNIGNFVIIETGNVDHPDNSKLYVKTDSGYSFITDLSGSQGITGPKGDVGYYFTPNIDETGLLTWTNNGNLANPDAINIKGNPFVYEDFTQEQLEGLKGPKGDTGISISNAEINFNNGHLILTLE